MQRGRGASEAKGPHDGLGVACLSPDQPSLCHSHWVLASGPRSGSAPTGRYRKPAEMAQGLGSALGPDPPGQRHRTHSVLCSPGGRTSCASRAAGCATWRPRSSASCPPTRRRTSCPSPSTRTSLPSGRRPPGLQSLSPAGAHSPGFLRCFWEGQGTCLWGQSGWVSEIGGI